MSEKLYRDIVDRLKQAGYELARNNKHAIYKSPDDKKGVAIGRNIQDKNLARSLLRSVGIQFSLAAMIVSAHAEAPPKESQDYQIMAPYAGEITNLKQPGTTDGCCSLSDCRPADIRTKGDHFEAYIRHRESDGSGWHDGPDKWLPVADSVIIRRSNIPMPVACWAQWHKENNGFFCLTLGNGT